MEDVKNALYIIKQHLSPGNIVKISMRMLACINKEITIHSIRTSFLSLQIAQHYNFKQIANIQTLTLLSLYHALGFYKDDYQFGYNPHNPNPEFFLCTPEYKSIYAYTSFYLKDMTPLGDATAALENFLEPLTHYEQHTVIGDYKKIIYFAAHISNFYKKHPDEPLPQDLSTLAPPGFIDNQCIDIFNDLNKDNAIFHAFKTNQAVEELSSFLSNIKYPIERTVQLQKLLVYFLDFKSTYTVSHAINTSCYAISLGLRCKLSNKELSELFSSAVLHDIGKIAIPKRILEFPGKLSPEDMGIMRLHVNHTKRILLECTPNKIITDAYRHHEKLNGKGYPNNLKADELSQVQRILTVADITSALNDSRSYKSEFSTDKIFRIIKEMTDAGELDGEITKFVLNEFDDISQEQQALLDILRVDFSNIFAKYNSYIMNDVEDLSDDIEDLEDL